MTIYDQISGPADYMLEVENLANDLATTLRHASLAEVALVIADNLHRLEEIASLARDARRLLEEAR